MATSLEQSGVEQSRSPTPGKPRELEDGLNRLIYHPLSRRLARTLVPTPVSPNMVSVAGGLLVVAAGVAYVQVGWPAGVVLGLALHLLWHVVDGADGDLARMTGRASANGELVDGLCDYGGHFALYLMLAASLDDTLGGWAWVLAVAAGVSRAFQSNHAESGRRTYLNWAYGVPWMRSSHDDGGEAFRRGSAVARLFGGLAALYVRAAAATGPATERANAVVDTVGADRGELRGYVRTAARRTLPLQAALGANPRTLLLGASMALGSPLWFFLVEVTVLNLLLGVSIVRQEAMAGRLIARFGGNGSNA